MCWHGCALLIEPRTRRLPCGHWARPPVELRQVDLARVVQIARRQRSMWSRRWAQRASPRSWRRRRESGSAFPGAARMGCAGARLGARRRCFVGRLIERLGCAGASSSPPMRWMQSAGGARDLCELAEEFADVSPRPPPDASIQLARAAEADPQAGAPLAAADSPGELDRAGEGDAGPCSGTHARAAARDAGALRAEVLGDVTDRGTPGGAAAGHGPGRLARDRALPGADQAGGAERASARREPRGGAGGRQRAPAGGDDAAAAGDL